MVKSIKRVLRDAIYTHFTTQLADELTGVQVVTAFARDELDPQHIRITTGIASPQIAGNRNLGRWDITAAITVVSQFDDTDEDTQDNLVGLVEAYVLQGNATLSAALTTSEIKVDNVMPGEAIDAVNEGMIYSGQELICECYMI